MSSWWAAIHGYRHPHLDAALTEQAGRMAHVMFGGLTHEPGVTLATRLAAMTGLPHVFFADSGSVSVEVALKMALQAQRGMGSPERTRFVTLEGGYHGDTFGAMSVCDPVGGMHSMFADVLPQNTFLPRPPAGLEADLGDWTTIC
jgi:adenosylmethionine-8-amino-7-oxononanoate aminotransferase